MEIEQYTNWQNVVQKELQGEHEWVKHGPVRGKVPRVIYPIFDLDEYDQDKSHHEGRHECALTHLQLLSLFLQVCLEVLLYGKDQKDEHGYEQHVCQPKQHACSNVVD